MTILNRKSTWRILCAAVLVVWMSPKEIHADAGKVIHSGPTGPYWVTVLAPTELRVGSGAIEVLIAEERGGKRVALEQVILFIEPAAVDEATANSPGPTPKLLLQSHGEYTFDCHFPSPGVWRAEVRLTGVGLEPTTSFSLIVSPALPPWQELWPWIAFPVMPITFFLLCQRTQD